MKMSFDEFKQEILNRKAEYLTKEMENAQVQITTVTKLNNSYEALVIRTPENTVGVSVNLDDLYKDSIGGMNDVIRKMRDTIDSLEYDAIRKLTESENNLLNYSDVKESLFIRCSNTERNALFLETCPHQDMGGVVLTVHVGLSWEPDSIPNYSAVVTNDMLRSWNITEEKLFTDARENTQKRLPVKMGRLSDFLMQAADTNELILPDDGPDIFVLTNGNGYFGASAAFYPDVLTKIHEGLGNYFMLPSSVHEWLIVPEDMEMNVAELERMVRDVNRYEVSEADFLSDDVYHFDGSRMELARDYEKGLKKDTMIGISEKPSAGEEKKADIAFTM